MEAFLFYSCGLLMLLGGILMVTSRSAVSAACWLVLALLGSAGLFASLHAPFLAVLQVLVYAGAIMVLFLFVIMLLNLGHDFREDLKRGVWAIFSFVVAGVLAGIIARQFGGTEGSPLYDHFGGGEAIDALLAERGAVGAIAHPLYTDYVVAFELTGILLLVAVVGALALAKRRV